MGYCVSYSSGNHFSKDAEWDENLVPSDWEDEEENKECENEYEEDEEDYSNYEEQELTYEELEIISLLITKELWDTKVTGEDRTNLIDLWDKLYEIRKYKNWRKRNEKCNTKEV